MTVDRRSEMVYCIGAAASAADPEPARDPKAKEITDSFSKFMVFAVWATLWPPKGDPEDPWVAPWPSKSAQEPPRSILDTQVLPK